jgi:hypothetical protein
MTFTILNRGTEAYRKRMIKTRVRMPDGTILQGRAGERVLSERQKIQEKARKEEKYLVK